MENFRKHSELWGVIEAAESDAAESMTPLSLTPYTVHDTAELDFKGVRETSFTHHSFTTHSPDKQAPHTHRTTHSLTITASYLLERTTKPHPFSREQLGLVPSLGNNLASYLLERTAELGTRQYCRDDETSHKVVCFCNITILLLLLLHLDTET